ncbi:MAG TPA: tail fiber protein [Pyrinomonadaceae bacterium]|jgi:microcystin-dependent protein
MADPFVAEIRIFPFNFAPKGWAFCDGQLLPLSQNTALFSLLGTVYGGDGKSTFALPDLQGRAAMHPGQGDGLSLRDLGQMGGAESITLLVSEMPLHTHTLKANDFTGDITIPSQTTSLAESGGGKLYVQANPAPALSQMAFQAAPPAGGSLPHNNMQPYLTLNFCIALQGVFPPRS